MNPIQKTALITGAGRGIGRSIALQFAQNGIDIVATARTSSELDQLKNDVEGLGARCKIVTTDLADRSMVFALIEEVKDQKVNVVVNNAGVGSSQNPKPLIEFDDAFWDLSMEVNVNAPYFITKNLLPSMIEFGFGRIINISSINAKVPALHGAAYTASKHAIAGLTKATANEIAGTGVTANAICPGVTATAMNDLRIQYDADRMGDNFQSVEKTSTPMGRRLLPDEIAPLALFLAGESSAAINGQLLNVCGGTVMAC